MTEFSKIATSWTYIMGIVFAGVFMLTGCQTEDSGKGSQAVLNGAGATFPSPVYASWCYNYTESTGKAVLVNYQGIGSGAGINQLKEGTIDFAGTDAPLSTEELNESGLVQFPMLAGGVVVVVNIPGVKDGDLKLSQKTLPDIFLGKIKKWNDPAIQSDNPQIKLPAMDISVVYRSDSSGTTFIFTDYLSKISPEWKEKAGCGKIITWPIGIGGQKNPGVCNNVAKISGAIGYTEYTYAVESKLVTTKLQNATGQFVPAQVKSFEEALKNINWEASPDFCGVFTNTRGDTSYPIIGITCILYSKTCDPAKRNLLHDYFNWCFVSGKNAATKMMYVPLPDEIVAKIRMEFGMSDSVEK